jgi:hypothetical protein
VKIEEEEKKKEKKKSIVKNLQSILETAVQAWRGCASTFQHHPRIWILSNK